mmetsp:Transcript_14345/g.25684  ORF Transcript_14345/g.25684 Transcript_14345/m.25684 type:complete len:96 (-) Transcript_14345:25-312(-)
MLLDNRFDDSNDIGDKSAVLVGIVHNMDVDPLAVSTCEWTAAGSIEQAAPIPVELRLQVEVLVGPTTWWKMELMYQRAEQSLDSTVETWIWFSLQ